MIERIFPPRPGPASDAELLAWYGPDTVPAGPWLSFNFVASADGAATVDGRSGQLGTPADQRLFQLLRRHAQVLLVGAQTIRSEGYGGALLDAEAQAWRRAHGFAAHPPLAIVSGSLRLSPQDPVFAQAPVRPLLFTVAQAPAARRRALAAVAEVIEVGEHTVDPARLLAALAARGLTRVHSEGGPTLLGGFAAAGLVDELCLTVSPLLAGGPAGRIAQAAQAGPVAALELVHVLRAESMLFLRYVRPRA